MSDTLSTPSTQTTESSQKTQKRTAVDRAKELRKVAARQRLLRQKLQELEGELPKKSSSTRSAGSGELLSGLADADWDEIKGQLDAVHREVENYIRENPTKAVLAAVGVGFVLGLLMKR